MDNRYCWRAQIFIYKSVEQYVVFWCSCKRVSCFLSSVSVKWSIDRVFSELFCYCCTFVPSSLLAPTDKNHHRGHSKGHRQTSFGVVYSQHISAEILTTHFALPHSNDPPTSLCFPSHPCIVCSAFGKKIPHRCFYLFHYCYLENLNLKLLFKTNKNQKNDAF